MCLAGLDLVFLRQRAAGGRLGRVRHRVQVRLRAVAQIDRIDLLARVDRLVLRTVDLEDGQRALVEGAEDRVIDEHVAARHLRCGTRTIAAPPDGISVVCTFSCDMRAAFVAHLVEDLADHVEARHQVRAAVADEQAHRLVGLRRDAPCRR